MPESQAGSFERPFEVQLNIPHALVIAVTYSMSQHYE